MVDISLYVYVSGMDVIYVTDNPHVDLFTLIVLLMIIQLYDYSSRLEGQTLRAILNKTACQLFSMKATHVIIGNISKTSAAG